MPLQRAACERAPCTTLSRPHHPCACNCDMVGLALCRYAWFAPRTYDFDWIGPSASLLLADQPVLTDVGALYIGAPNSTRSRSSAPAPASEVSIMAPGAAGPTFQAPPRGVAGQAAAGGAAPAAEPWAAAGAAGGGLAGGTWRDVCRVCSDQAAGLGALAAPERAARLQQCRACGYWNYGSGLSDQDAGTLRPGSEATQQHARDNEAVACMSMKGLHSRPRRTGLQRAQLHACTRRRKCNSVKRDTNAVLSSAGARPAMPVCARALSATTCNSSALTAAPCRCMERIVRLL